MEGPGERAMRVAAMLLVGALALIAVGSVVLVAAVGSLGLDVLRLLVGAMVLGNLLLVASVATAAYAIVERRRHRRSTRGAWLLALGGVLASLAYWLFLAPIVTSIRADLAL